MKEKIYYFRGQIEEGKNYTWMDTARMARMGGHYTHGILKKCAGRWPKKKASKQFLMKKILLLIAIATTAQADEYDEQRQTAILQQMQQQQTTEFLLDYGRQASENFEAQMPEARGRAIREEYIERKAYEQAITGE